MYPAVLSFPVYYAILDSYCETVGCVIVYHPYLVATTHVCTYYKSAIWLDGPQSHTWDMIKSWAVSCCLVSLCLYRRLTIAQS